MSRLPYSVGQSKPQGYSRPRAGEVGASPSREKPESTVAIFSSTVEDSEVQISTQGGCQTLVRDKLHSQEEIVNACVLTRSFSQHTGQTSSTV